MGVNLDNLIANALSAAKGGRKSPFSKAEVRQAMLLFIDGLTGSVVEESLLGRAAEATDSLQEGLSTAYKMENLLYEQVEGLKRKLDGLATSAQAAESINELPEQAAITVRLTAMVADALGRAVRRVDDHGSRMEDQVARTIVTSTSYIVWAYLTGERELPRKQEDDSE